MGDLQPPTRTGSITNEDQFYDRQLRVSGWGPEGQKRLKGSSVLVVGAGGLGCPALLYLAGAGVGRLGVADPDMVSLSNLPRQILFTPNDVGHPKAQCAALRLKEQNPWITIESLNIKVQRDNVRSLVESYDLIVDGTDNFETKYLLHDACYAGNKPLVMASLYQWESQIQVFSFHKSGPGCLRCLYPQAPEDGCVGTCAQVGVAGALAGTTGSTQAIAAVQILLGMNTQSTCETLIMDFRSWEPKKLKWKPDPTCTCSRPRSWDFLKINSPALQKEISWDQASSKDWPVAVDIREISEVKPGDWDKIKKRGFLVRHEPLSQWEISPPHWEENQGYLLVCAAGVRSLGGLKLVPQNTTSRFISLKGGMISIEGRSGP